MSTFSCSLKGKKEFNLMRAKGFYAVIYFRRVHLYTRLQPQGGRKNFLLLFVSDSNLFGKFWRWKSPQNEKSWKILRSTFDLNFFPIFVSYNTITSEN